MAMSQPKVQAPFVPGQKEAAELVDDQHSSGNRGTGTSVSTSDPGKFISFVGNSGDGDEPEGEQPTESTVSSLETNEHERRGESRGTLGTGHDVASEVSESLDVVHRTLETGFKGVFGTAKDAVQRAKQGLLDILPSGLSSSSDQAQQVVEDVEKDMLANSEGSGEDRSHVSEGPEGNNSATAQPRSTRETTPTFMRAKM